MAEDVTSLTPLLPSRSPDRILNRRFWRHAGLLVGFWFALGLYSTLLVYYRSALSSRPYTLSKAFQSEIIYSLIAAAFSPLVLYLARRYRLERLTLRRHLLIHLVAGALISATTKIIWDFALIEHLPASYRPVSLGNILRSIGYGFDYGFVIYWVIVIADSGIEYYRRYQAGTLEAAQLQTQLARAQVQALRTQINPHFLFNTLHSVSELVHSDPLAAEQMIARLSQLLRRSLDTSDLLEVPLSQEVDFLRLYLDIERVRFEDRLRAEFDIDPATESALVPNLILQPLVENAIRHGIAHRLSGGRILIRSRRAEQNLELSITDDGVGLPAAGMREGIGLSTTRERLEKLYRGDGHFQILPLPEGVECRLRFPIRLHPEEKVRKVYAAH